MYHVFGHDQYYPSGGMADYIGSYATPDEAVNAFKKAGTESGELVQVQGDKLVVVAGLQDAGKEITVTWHQERTP